MPGGRARDGPGAPHHQPAEVDRVQPVDVLARGRPRAARPRRRGPSATGSARGRRRRRSSALKRSIDGEQLGLGGVGGQVLVERRDAELGAVLVLEPDVGRARRVVADEDRAEPGRDAARPQVLDLGRQLRLHLGQQRRAVERDRAIDCTAAQCRKWRSPVKTMAMPCSSAAAMTSSSRTEPPGWMTAATPADAQASRPSRNGKKASLAAAPPLARPAAFSRRDARRRRAGSAARRRCRPPGRRPPARWCSTSRGRRPARPARGRATARRWASTLVTTRHDSRRARRSGRPAAPGGRRRSSARRAGRGRAGRPRAPAGSSSPVSTSSAPGSYAGATTTSVNTGAIASASSAGTGRLTATMPPNADTGSHSWARL